jgi:hypothetical protein
MTTRLPVAGVLTITPTKTTRLVTIRCPVCRRKHTHGWPYTTDTIGARVAHCVTRNIPHGAPGNYFIPTPHEDTADRSLETEKCPYSPPFARIGVPGSGSAPPEERMGGGESRTSMPVTTAY